LVPLARFLMQRYTLQLLQYWETFCPQIIHRPLLKFRAFILPSDRRLVTSRLLPSSVYSIPGKCMPDLREGSRSHCFLDLGRTCCCAGSSWREDHKSAHNSSTNSCLNFRWVMPGSILPEWVHNRNVFTTATLRKCVKTLCIQVTVLMRGR
jgi:hypothetical protein